VALNPDKVELAFEVALTSLSQVAATGTNEERVAASKVLVEAVEVYEVQRRKNELAASVSPLVDVLVRNLSGLLDASDRYCPALTLEPAQAGSLVLSLTQTVSK
jgi:hypothetical protein